jgi:hypothetical protein
LLRSRMRKQARITIERVEKAAPQVGPAISEPG